VSRTSELYNVIGNGVTEDASLSPAIPRCARLQPDLRKGRAGQGCGFAQPPDGRSLHAAFRHSGPSSGAIAGKTEIVLEAWDTISVPLGSDARLSVTWAGSPPA